MNTCMYIYIHMSTDIILSFDEYYLLKVTFNFVFTRYLNKFFNAHFLIFLCFDLQNNSYKRERTRMIQ